MAVFLSQAWLARIVIALAVFQGGWMAIDGTRAFIAGDYFTARTGLRAGQLGPWATLVSAAGIEPRSTFMKAIHVGLGGAWLGVAVAFAIRLPWAQTGMVVCAVASLWYAPVGTFLSAIQLALLLRRS